MAAPQRGSAGATRDRRWLRLRRWTRRRSRCRLKSASWKRRRRCGMSLSTAALPCRGESTATAMNSPTTSLTRALLISAALGDTARGANVRCADGGGKGSGLGPGGPPSDGGCGEVRGADGGNHTTMPRARGVAVSAAWEPRRHHRRGPQVQAGKGLMAIAHLLQAGKGAGNHGKRFA